MTLRARLKRMFWMNLLAWLVALVLLSLDHNVRAHLMVLWDGCDWFWWDPICWFSGGGG